MTRRKKWGILTVINGSFLIVIGILVFSTASTPIFLGVVIQALGVLFDLFGFSLVYPDIP